jgi:hypothetical protein
MLLILLFRTLLDEIETPFPDIEGKTHMLQVRIPREIVEMAVGVLVNRPADGKCTSCFSFARAYCCFFGGWGADLVLPSRRILHRPAESTLASASLPWSLRPCEAEPDAFLLVHNEPLALFKFKIGPLTPTGEPSISGDGDFKPPGLALRCISAHLLTVPLPRVTPARKLNPWVSFIFPRMSQPVIMLQPLPRKPK